MENEAGYLINLHGAIDMHFHPAPCLFPRLATDWEIARAAHVADLGGLLLKCHHESTVSRARALRKDFPGMHIFGGVVLNSYVGGINPKAVEATLKMGGKEVWLPTIDSAYHAKIHGTTGKYDVQSAGDSQTVVDGKVIPEAVEVFRLVADYGAILGTAHQSFEELKVIIPAAREAGVQKILLTHPFFKVPGLTLEQTAELVSLGCLAEFGYCTVSPMWAYATIPQVARAILSLGAENCIIISDAGQRSNPMPPEALRIFAQGLFESGVPETDLDILLRTNPARLLDLDLDEICAHRTTSANAV
jgi:hypothetical protein